MRFKVGEKIVCTQNHYSYFTKNNNYDLIDLVEKPNQTLLVVKDNDGMLNFVNESIFIPFRIHRENKLNRLISKC
jgi:hypothetical protein